MCQACNDKIERASHPQAGAAVAARHGLEAEYEPIPLAQRAEACEKVGMKLARDRYVNDMTRA